MIEMSLGKQGKTREIPKIIKEALAKASLTTKLDETSLLSSPMTNETTTQIERLCIMSKGK
jgi:hypothetical protein